MSAERILEAGLDYTVTPRRGFRRFIDPNADDGIPVYPVEMAREVIPEWREAPSPAEAAGASV